MDNLDYFNNFFSQKVMPLVYDESLSYYEVLNKLITFTNSLITAFNELNTSNKTLNNNYTSVINSLEEIKKEIENMKNGDFLKDGSITPKKLSYTVFQEFNDFILKTIQNTAKFVAFGLNNDGYFIADIPSSWNEITFSTDSDNRLVLNY